MSNVANRVSSGLGLNSGRGVYGFPFKALCTSLKSVKNLALRSSGLLLVSGAKNALLHHAVGW